MHQRYRSTKDENIIHQLANLRRGVFLIRDMQGLGIASLLLCVVCMLLLFLGWVTAATCTFGVSLVLLIASLGYSIAEIKMSVGALNIALHDLEEEGKP